MKKVFVFCIVAMAVFGFFSAKIGAQELWATVPNIDFLNGTWKLSIDQNQTAREYVEKQGETWTSEMQNEFGNFRERKRGEITITVNANAKTIIFSGATAVVYSGEDVNTLWQEIEYYFEDWINNDNITFNINNSNHSITSTFFTLYSYNSFFSDSYGRGHFKINQNLTKIKLNYLPLDYIFWGFLIHEEEFEEFIFIKQ